MSLMVQVKLRKGKTHLTGWIPYVKSLALGKLITLKEYPEEKWLIEGLSKPVERDEINREWRVGGL